MTKQVDYRTHLRERLVGCDVPQTLHDGLVEYFAARRPTGSFLRAVLEGDLVQACLRADESNRLEISHIVSFLFFYCPAPAWGSPTKVDAWLASADAVPEVFE